MMSETPQAVVRVTFLLVVSLLFAAIWHGDHAPGSRSSVASRNGSAAEVPTSLPGWEATGTDLPEGESGEMVRRHAESDTDPAAWEQAGNRPPWTAPGTDLPTGESAAMMHRHAESETDPDAWEHAGSRPPWTAPGTDLPQGEAESIAGGDHDEASTSVNRVEGRTHTSRPESQLDLAVARSVVGTLGDIARSHLPTAITTGTYRVVDNAGRTTRITLTRDDLVTGQASAAAPIYETSPAPGLQIYWIRIERPAPIRKAVVNRVTAREADLSNDVPPAPTVTGSAALLTGSINEGSAGTPSNGWLNQAGRWMGRALELVRGLPVEPTPGVRR